MNSGPSLITDVSTAEFPVVVIQSTLPVLVDFWAPWCGPCRQLSPLLMQLAGEFEGKLIVAKVNVDEEPGLAQSFGIRGIPALIWFSKGQPKEMITGLRSVSDLRLWIQQHLAAG